jgi:SSS family solute:Na+ symporter
MEILLFTIFVVSVVALGLYQGNKSTGDAEGGEASSYFLAGRGLTWWLVGFSLIAANISTEQFVGMSGKAADWLGMAIASYEWMAAVTLVIVAFIFLPKFLKAGIYTAPEFLEYRYGVFSRFVMAVATLVILVGVPTASVIFSGAKVVSVYYPDNPILGNLTYACWLIAGLAAIYVFIGGLKACAWTDLIWGASLILGGAIVAYLAFSDLASMAPEDLAKTATTANMDPAQLADANAWERFQLLNSGAAEEGGKLHMRRPIDDDEIPWTALVLGLWIPNFFYWGLNQYIIQRTLGSKSLAEGQKGIIFAAFLKLLIPFLVVIPGILAFNMYSHDLHESAKERSEKAIASADSKEPFVVSDDFVRLQPALASEVLAINEKLAGETSGISAEASAIDIAAEINRLSEVAVANGVDAGPKLVGYDYDSAFPVLLKNLIKPRPYLSWFVLAAIFGAVVSSLASMLNSASTIATIDLYRKVDRNASQARLVMAGRCFVVLFVGIAAYIAPMLASPKFGGIFTFIQEFQGFISPGVLAVFLFGVLVPRAPRFLGWSGILLGAATYGALMVGLGDWIGEHGLWFTESISFLDRMAISFLIVVGYCLLMTLVAPLKIPVVLPVNESMDLTSSPVAKFCGALVIGLTAILYYVFW